MKLTVDKQEFDELVSQAQPHEVMSTEEQTEHVVTAVLNSLGIEREESTLVGQVFFDPVVTGRTVTVIGDDGEDIVTVQDSPNAGHPYPIFKSTLFINYYQEDK